MILHASYTLVHNAEGLAAIIIPNSSGASAAKLRTQRCRGLETTGQGVKTIILHQLEGLMWLSGKSSNKKNILEDEIQFILFYFVCIDVIIIVSCHD